jgi:predicted thioesterase
MVDLTPLAGLIGTAQLKVGAEHTAPFVGSGRIAVLATPVMINIIEAAALNAIERLLPIDHQSPGIRSISGRRTCITSAQAHAKAPSPPPTMHSS